MLQSYTYPFYKLLRAEEDSGTTKSIMEGYYFGGKGGLGEEANFDFKYMHVTTTAEQGAYRNSAWERMRLREETS